MVIEPKKACKSKTRDAPGGESERAPVIAHPSPTTSLSAPIARAIDPIDRVRIKNQFSLWFQITKYRYFLTADYRQLLFLEQVQPAYKDVGFGAAPEVTGSQ